MKRNLKEALEPDAKRQCYVDSASLLDIVTLRELLVHIPIGHWSRLVQLNKSFARRFCNKNDSPYKPVVDWLLKHPLNLLPDKSSDVCPIDRPWTLVHYLMAEGDYYTFYCNIDRLHNLNFARSLVGLILRPWYKAESWLKNNICLDKITTRTLCGYERAPAATLRAKGDLYLRYFTIIHRDYESFALFNKNGFQEMAANGRLTGQYIFRVEKLALQGRQLLYMLFYDLGFQLENDEWYLSFHDKRQKSNYVETCREFLLKINSC